MKRLVERFGEENIKDLLEGTNFAQAAETDGFGLIILQCACQPTDMKVLVNGDMGALFNGDMEALGDGRKGSSSRKACKTGPECHHLQNGELTRFQ